MEHRKMASELSDEILEKILGYLNVLSLLQTRLVSKKWFQASMQALKRRHIRYIMYLSENVDIEELDDFAEILLLCHDIATQERIQFFMYEADVSDAIISFIRQSMIWRPKCSIVFADVFVPGDIHVPDGYPIIALDGGQPILCPPPRQIEAIRYLSRYGHGSTELIVARFLEGLYSDYTATITEWSSSENSDWIEQFSVDNPLKCLLIFQDKRGDILSSNFIQSIDQIEKDIPMAGGAFDRVWYNVKGSKCTECQSALITIAFSGKNVEAASLVLNKHEEASTRRKLLDFKDSLNFNPDKKSDFEYTIGFIFDGTSGVGFWDDYKNIGLLNFINTVFPKVAFTGTTLYDGYVRDILRTRCLDSSDPSYSDCDLAMDVNLVLIHFNQDASIKSSI